MNQTCQKFRRWPALSRSKQETRGKLSHPANYCQEKRIVEYCDFIANRQAYILDGQSSISAALANRFRKITNLISTNSWLSLLIYVFLVNTLLNTHPPSIHPSSTHLDHKIKASSPDSLLHILLLPPEWCPSLAVKLDPANFQIFFLR